MNTPALVSRFFRIGTSGPTVDGREISADDLEAMAASYDPDEYSASINIEHIRGISPWSQFGSLGQVVALETRKDKKKRTAIYAQVAPTPYMVQLKKAGQKLFSSMEIMPDFAGTGKPYLVGLAVTDEPASLGVEAMQFSAKKGGPADDRFKNNLFSTHYKLKDIPMKDKDDNKPDGDAPKPEPTFAEKFKAKFAKKDAADTENFSQHETAMLELADKFTALETSQTELTDKFAASEKANKELTEKVEAQAATIKKLSAQPEGGDRPPATPAEGANLTDC